MPAPIHSTGNKQCGLDDLLARRDRARDAGRTVVHCHGCFDIVHPGHIQYLQYARSLGDELVVSLTADAQVNKGVDRPLIPDDLRAASVAALECVDHVYVNDAATAVALLEALQPDVYVKGKEYERNADPRFAAEREAVTRHGGRVVFSSGEVVYSSTALIASLAGRQAFDGAKIDRYRAQHGLDVAALMRLAREFRGKRVTVVGDYILDRYHFCHPTGVAGEAPVMSMSHLRTQDYDGGAAVVALHLAALGAEPTLVTHLADDDESARTALRLRAAGVAVEAVPHRPGLVKKHRYLAERTKLFKVDEGAAAAADSQAVEWTVRATLAAAEGAAAAVFCDFGYGVVSASLLDRVMTPLRAAVPVITADVSGRQGSLLRFRGVDLLCPTEREMREALQDFSSGLGAAAWNLPAATGARQAILTMGKQGLVTFDRDAADPSARLRSAYLPALSTDAVDALGCGDALLATATLALAGGASLAAAAYLGSVAAAIQAQSIGNPPVTWDALADALAGVGAGAGHRIAG